MVNVVMEIFCLTFGSHVIRTGQVGRPKTTFKEGVKIRVKNKGSQTHKKGPKRPKYQSPKPEHPFTPKNLENKQIHANGLSRHLIVLYDEK